MGFELHFTPPKRVCSCCGEEKPLTEYYRQSVTGQPMGQCKECVRIKQHCNGKRIRRSVQRFSAKEKHRNVGLEVVYTQEDWLATMLFFKGRCAYCGVPEGRAAKERFDKDHVVPLAKGGRTERHNIVPACRQCNRGRGSRDAVAWLKEQPFWTQEREARLTQWVSTVDKEETT